MKLRASYLKVNKNELPTNISKETIVFKELARVAVIQILMVSGGSSDLQ